MYNWWKLTSFSRPKLRFPVQNILKQSPLSSPAITGTDLRLVYLHRDSHCAEIYKKKIPKIHHLIFKVWIYPLIIHQLLSTGSAPGTCYDRGYFHSNSVYNQCHHCPPTHTTKEREDYRILHVLKMSLEFCLQPTTYLQIGNDLSRATNELCKKKKILLLCTKKIKFNYLLSPNLYPP